MEDTFASCRCSRTNCAEERSFTTFGRCKHNEKLSTSNTAAKHTIEFRCKTSLTYHCSIVRCPWEIGFEEVSDLCMDLLADFHCSVNIIRNDIDVQIHFAEVRRSVTGSLRQILANSKLMDGILKFKVTYFWRIV